VNKLLPILLISSICLTQELEVDGDLKVTGTVESTTIDSLQLQINSLLILISSLEMRIAQLECQNTGIIPEGYCDCFFHTLDLCGVCNGDTTSCQDCAGVPNGDSLQDMCGYCDNDSSNDCVQDCLGEWGGTAVEDVCGDCGGDAENEDECNFALSFDGVDDYISINDSYELNPNFYTIAAWIKHDSPSTNYSGIVAKQPGGDSGYLLQLTSGYAIQTVVSSGNTYIYVNSGLQLNANEYYYVVSTFNGYALKLYINGNLHGEINYIGSNIPNNVDLTIGWRAGGPEYFKGMIDEVAIWDQALIDNEITALYNSGSGLSAESNSGNYVSSSYLQGYWKFNEGSGNILNDLSENGNHGTIHGATWVER